MKNRNASKPPHARATARRMINLTPDQSDRLAAHLRERGERWNPWIRRVIEKELQKNEN